MLALCMMSAGLIVSAGIDVDGLGATSGIGAETARVLALRGVRVVIPARNLKKGCEVRERILLQSPNAEVIVMEIDLSSFTSIKRFCAEFLSLDLPLNILMYVPLRINKFNFCLIISLLLTDM